MSRPIPSKYTFTPRHCKLLICAVIIIGILLYITIFIFVSKCNPYDFSQEYRHIDGYKNIVFRDNWNKYDFCRSIWGLQITDNYDAFEEHRLIDRNSNEYKILAENVETSYIEQIVLSPDGNYILYVQSIYRGSGVTDDEDVYYRVYDIKNNTVVTIYSGYKAFLLVDWK